MWYRHKYMKKGVKKGSGAAVLSGGPFDSKVVYDARIIGRYEWNILRLNKIHSCDINSFSDIIEPQPIKKLRYFSTKQLDKYGRVIYEYEHKRVGKKWEVQKEYKQNEKVCQLMWKVNKLKSEIEKVGSVGCHEEIIHLLNKQLSETNKELLSYLDKKNNINN